MARKQTIQTNLLGRTVRLKGTRVREKGRTAEIVNVFLDTDGNPRYTLRLLEGNSAGQLWDCYDLEFLI